MDFERKVKFFTLFNSVGIFSRENFSVSCSISTFKHNIPFLFQIEDLERDLKMVRLDLETGAVTLQAELEHSANLDKQIKEAYNERIEMAKKCLEKDDEVPFVCLFTRRTGTNFAEL